MWGPHATALTILPLWDATAVCKDNQGPWLIEDMVSDAMFGILGLVPRLRAVLSDTVWPGLPTAGEESDAPAALLPPPLEVEALV